MAHQYLNDGEEEGARARSESEPERRDATHEDASAEEASSPVDEIATTPVTPRRQRRPRSGDRAEAPGMAADAEADKALPPSREDDLRDLEAQGFTQDEANRLIDLSARINEGISNEPTLKRLQFARWLVQRGLLDEFSPRGE